MSDLLHHVTTCPQCGCGAGRHDVWCGWCGAPLPPAAAAAGPVPDVGDSTVASAVTSAPPPRRAVRTLLAAGLLLALVTGALLTRPAPVGESLVGRLDVPSGPSATRPPPAGLRVAWRQPVGEPVDGRVSVGGMHQLLARDGRLAVDSFAGGVVVDTATGAVVADLRDPGLHRTWSPDGEVAVLHGGRLLVADVLTGEVVARVPLDPATLPPTIGRLVPAAAARGPGTSLFAIWSDRWGPPEGWVLLDDGGAVVARGQGDPLGWGSDLPSGGYAPVVLDADVDAGGNIVMEGSAVLDLATGEEVLRVVSDGDLRSWALPQVVDGMAFVATRRPGADDRAWRLELYDLATRRKRWTVALDADEPPTLLAVTPSGDAVIGVRDGIALRAMSTRELTVLATVPAPGLVRDGGWGGAAARELIAADGDVAVLADLLRDELVAVGLDGTPRWRAPLPVRSGATIDLGVVSDLVVLSVDGGHGLRLHLLDRATGETLHRVDLGLPGGSWAPAVAVSTDDVVAIDDGGDDGGIMTMDWFDVRTGRELAWSDVVARWLRGIDLPAELIGPAGTPVPAAFVHARLSGTLPDGHGRARPVLAWPEDGGRLDLLLDRDGLTTIALPETDGLRMPGWDVAAVAGDTLVLHNDAWDGAWASDSEAWVPDRHLTVLLERGAAPAAVLPDVRPVGIAGDVLVGLREADEGAASLVVHGLDGALRWQVPWTPADLVAADDRQVVIAAGVDVTARRSGDGTVLWRTALDRSATGSLVLTEESVLLRTDYGEALALDRDDGGLSWRHDVGRPLTTLAAAGAHALVGTGDGWVVHLDGAGREVQRVDLGRGPVTGIAADGSTVVATLSDEVVGLRDVPARSSPPDQVWLP